MGDRQNEQYKLCCAIGRKCSSSRGQSSDFKRILGVSEVCVRLVACAVIRGWPVPIEGTCSSGAVAPPSSGFHHLNPSTLLPNPFLLLFFSRFP
jgi:hypothetical protein